MKLHESVAAFIVAAIVASAATSRADELPLLLFGGPNHDRFLGCLNCDDSEVFSIWNEDGEYGSPAQPDCIWNRNGDYGSPSGRFSPWNRNSNSPPFVVDRAGNFYGYLTRNTSIRDSVMHKRSQARVYTELERRIYAFLSWFIEDYDLIIANLDEVRSNR